MAESDEEGIDESSPVDPQDEEAVYPENENNDALTDFLEGGDVNPAERTETGVPPDLENEIQELRTHVDQLAKEIDRIAHPLQRVFVAQVTGSGTWQEQTNVAGIWQDYTGGRNSVGGAATPLYLSAGTAGARTIFIEDRDGPNSRYTPIVFPGTAIFVALSTTSGATGDATHQATYVYTVKTFDSTATIATGLSPAYRERNGNFDAATMGIGYFDNSGAFVLVVAFEPAHTTPGCVPSS